MTADADPAGGGDGSQTNVFISYSRADTAFANRLEAALKARGFEPLIDRTDIYVFEDWWQRIQDLIAQADTVVFVLSPHAISSRICLKEVEYAASLNKRFAPIVYQQVSASLVPAELRRLNWLNFQDEDQFDNSVDNLATA